MIPWSNYRQLFTKILLTLAGITVWLAIAPVVFAAAYSIIYHLVTGSYVSTDYKAAHYPHIKLEGVVEDVGIVSNGYLTGATIIQTPQGTYILIDRTDKVSRKQKADPQYCPAEGTIDCYLGRRVRIEGLLTDEKEPVLPPGKKEEVVAQKIEVLSFDVLK